MRRPGQLSRTHCRVRSKNQNWFKRTPNHLAPRGRMELQVRSVYITQPIKSTQQWREIKEVLDAKQIIGPLHYVDSKLGTGIGMMGLTERHLAQVGIQPLRSTHARVQGIADELKCHQNLKKLKKKRRFPIMSTESLGLSQTSLEIINLRWGAPLVIVSS